MTIVRLQHPLRAMCESCQHQLATHLAYDAVSEFSVCGSCLPATATVPAQVR